MSVFSNAPLIEVVFELFWKVEGLESLDNFQYLHGDLYNNVKSHYPYRESIYKQQIPFEILKNRPIFRYRKSDKGYPLLQIGPGIATANTVNIYYDWDNFKLEIKYLTSELIKLSSLSTMKIVPRLSYYDFIPFEYSQKNIFEFLHQNFKFNVNQEFVGSETNLNMFNSEFSYMFNNDSIGISLSTRIHNSVEGIWMESKVEGTEMDLVVDDILSWNEQAHNTCKNIFSSMFTSEFFSNFK